MSNLIEPTDSVPLGIKERAVLGSKIADALEELVICIQQPLSQGTLRRRAELNQTIIAAIAKANHELMATQSRGSKVQVRVSEQRELTIEAYGKFVDCLRTLAEELYSMRARNHDDGAVGSLLRDRYQGSELLKVAKGFREYRLHAELILSGEPLHRCKMRLMTEREQLLLAGQEERERFYEQEIGKALQTWFERIETELDRICGSSARTYEHSDSKNTMDDSGNVLVIIDEDYLHPRWNGETIPMENSVRATVLERLVIHGGGPLADLHLSAEATGSKSNGENPRPLRELFRVGKNKTLHPAWGTLIVEAKRADGTPMQSHRMIPTKNIKKIWSDCEATG